MSFVSRLEPVLVSCIESSTVHGLANIFRNKHWLLKLAWLACVLASFGFCLSNLISLFLAYFSYEVNTKTEYQQLGSIQFPTVSFCNKKPFNFKNNNTNTEIIKKDIEALKKEIFDLNEQNANTFLTLVDKDFHYPILLHKYKDMLPNISFDIDDLLVNCQFNMVDCNKDNIERFTLPNFGNCYKFNSGKSSNGQKIEIEKTKIPGKKYGLKMEFYTGHLEPDFDLIRAGGIHLMIHNSSDAIFSEYDSISLATGFETDIVLSQESRHKMSKPYSGCVQDPTSSEAFDSNLYRKCVQLFGKYQQKTCLIMCYYENIYEKCGCHYPEAIGASYNSTCKNNSQMECSQMAFVSYLDESPGCLDVCPEECKIYKFKKELSFANFPSPFYAELMAGNPTYQKKWNFTNQDIIKETVVSVNIYYDDIGITYVKDTVAMDTVQLICNLGGIIGACLGMSMLSLVEALDLVIKILLSLFERKKSKKVSSIT